MMYHMGFGGGVLFFCISREKLCVHVIILPKETNYYGGP